jgi:hypothetical protein
MSWIGMLDSYKRLNNGCKAFNASEKLSSNMLLSCIDCIGRLDRFGRITRSRNPNLNAEHVQAGDAEEYASGWDKIAFHKLCADSATLCYGVGLHVILARRKRSGHHPLTRGTLSHGAAIRGKGGTYPDSHRQWKKPEM